MHLQSCGVAVAGGSLSVEVADEFSSFVYVLHCAIEARVLSHVDGESFVSSKYVAVMFMYWTGHRCAAAMQSNVSTDVFSAMKVDVCLGSKCCSGFIWSPRMEQCDLSLSIFRPVYA